MKRIEVRRHAERESGSEALTEAGRAAAQLLGRASILNPYDLAVSSSLGRATETVSAMGYTVAGTDLVWSSLWEGFDGQLPGLKTIHDFQAAFNSGGLAETFGRNLAAAAIGLAESRRDGDRILVITHGGVPELLVAALSPNDSSLGSEKAFLYLEGVAIEIDKGKVVRIEVLRGPSR